MLDTMKNGENSPYSDDLSDLWVGRHIYRPCQGVLFVDEQPVELEPRLNDLLIFFVKNPGVVISRDRLISEVWGRVVSDDALNRAISILRKQLAGRSGMHKHYIRTLPKRGYRLDAKVLPYVRKQPTFATNIKSNIPRIAAGLIVGVFASYGLFTMVKPLFDAI